MLRPESGVMHFVVQHDTHYRYSVPVVLAPHLLRLTPRSADARLISRTLLIQPQPIEQRDELDPFGNQVTAVSFSGWSSDHLHIQSRFQLDTRVPPPLPGDGAWAMLPWPAHPNDDLLAYRLDPGGVDPGVAAFARTLASAAGHQPLAFLDHLCQTLYTRTDRQVRPTGDAQSPAETLASWRGACRDLTVLFLAAARSLGLAGRFCSGYQAAADTPDGRRHLHAWPEIFLPGLGWRGWDPTHGVPAGEGHVALCAAPEQSATMPVVGGYYFGSSITATLDFEVRIATSPTSAGGAVPAL